MTDSIIFCHELQLTLNNNMENLRYNSPFFEGIEINFLVKLFSLFDGSFLIYMFEDGLLSFSDENYSKLGDNGREFVF